VDIWELINNFVKQKIAVGNLLGPLLKKFLEILLGASILPARILVKKLISTGLEGLGLTLHFTKKCMPSLMQILISKAKVELLLLRIRQLLEVHITITG
jgi:hypothetical protein